MEYEIGLLTYSNCSFLFAVSKIVVKCGVTTISVVLSGEMGAFVIFYSVDVETIECRAIYQT